MNRLAIEFNTSLPESTLATLALLQLPGIGVARYWKLIARFGGPEAMLNLSAAELALAFKDENQSLWKNFVNNPQATELGQALKRQLDVIEQQQIALLPFDSDNYPALLAEISQPPPVLYLQGDSRCLELPQIGIVGSRKPTPVGLDNAEHFAHYLAKQGLAITSGLALGVDASAHSGALRAGGKTLAVLGSGLGCVYPHQNKGLAADIIAAGGLLISEYPPLTSARPGNFPQRNRIISGLSLGVLVVEAAAKSGSLITARLASEQGREVFALPGSIHCPVSRGCNGLIRQGATLVESAEQMIDELQGLLALKSEQLTLLPQADEAPKLKRDLKPSSLQQHQQQLLDKMGYELVSFDTIAERTELDVSVLLGELMSMELAGLISQLPGGYLRRAP